MIPVFTVTALRYAYKPTDESKRYRISCEMAAEMLTARFKLV